jgi:hypothetical protein
MGDGRYLTVRQVKQRVGRVLRGYWARSRRTYAGFSDNEFYLPTRAEIEMLLAERPIRKARVRDESFDCDDFAFVFKGMVALEGRDLDHVTSSMCVGIAWGYFRWIPDTFHAVNWALVDDSEFVWIEPQDGTIHPVDASESGLSLLIA